MPDVSSTQSLEIFLEKNGLKVRERLGRRPPPKSLPSALSLFTSFPFNLILPFPSKPASVMSPTPLHTLLLSTQVFNSSCPWSSEIEQLRELYASPSTGAVVTRTATLDGFAQDSKIHGVGRRAVDLYYELQADWKSHSSPSLACLPQELDLQRQHLRLFSASSFLLSLRRQNHPRGEPII